MSANRGRVPPPPPPPIGIGSGKRVNPGGSMNVGLSKRLSDELSQMLEADDFSIGGYLNKALAVERSSASSGISPDDIEVERLMAKVALQLQLETQSCHDEIGRIGAELQAILPRCNADINRLAVGLDGMKDDTQALVDSFTASSNTTSTPSSGNPNAKSASGEGSAQDTMKTLSTLHALQMNLTFTKTILEATSSWDTTMSSIPSLLSNQKLSEAVTALTNLQQGARALRGMPGKEQRDETILKFKTQIETLLKPQLLHAFANIETRINLLHQSHHMYKQLGNLDNFVFEYVKNRPTDLHKGWFDFTPTLSTATSTTTDSETQAISNLVPEQSQQNSFIAFLPQWYDTILALLSEERRRTQTVFGNDAAPIVTAKILAEIFRPISKSFQSRLSSIYSPQTKNSGNNVIQNKDVTTLSYAGSLETICDAYEATLSFLCVAYDHIVDNVASQTDPSGKDSTHISSSNLPYNDIPHFELVKNIYIELASPFSPYQEQFSALELQNSSIQLAQIAKNIHAAVRLFSASAGSISLTHLQESIDKLEEFTPLVFSIVEGAMARFELLNCGHHAVEALSTIDKLLNNHTTELSIAINTLSATMVSDDDRLAESFDEQHVQCALEVLKIAGRYKQELKKFESNTRIKLRAQISKLQGLQSIELFQADSISPVELATLLASSICCSKNGNKDSEAKMSIASSLNQLQRLSGKSTGSSTSYDQSPILPSAHDAVAKLAHSCHTFVFDICSAVPKKYLRTLSSSSVWRETAPDSSKSSSGLDYDMPMSILPQAYITQVGEHMLALVQALEPFASSSDALYLANHVMGEELMQVAIQPWNELLDATTLHSGKHLGISNIDELVKRMMNGKKLDTSLGMTWKEFDGNFPTSPIIEDDEEGEIQDEFERASAMFCNEWLDVIGTAVTGRILERILRIHRLSDLGAQHLATDLNYILNVFSALGISGHPHPLLKHFDNLVSMKKEDLTARVVLARDFKSDFMKKSNNVEKLLWTVEERIASMRDALP